MGKYTLSIPNNPKLFNPHGINGLKLGIEKKDGDIFFRQKMTGALSFSNADYENMSYLESECCKEVQVKIFHSCSGLNETLLQGSFKSNLLEWNFENCTATLPQLTVQDSYIGFYKYWKKKVNMCSIAKESTYLRYFLRYPDANDDNKPKETLFVVNNIYANFVKWVHHCIEQAFLGTEMEYLIPSTSQMSIFLNSDINVASGKKNPLKTACILQASDFLYPDKTRASGLTATGLLSESVAITLKDLLENLANTFDLYWFINPDTGLIQIEHLCFFENSLSYDIATTPQAIENKIGLDLTQDPYPNILHKYKYSYKTNIDDFYGEEELQFSLNDALFKSSHCTNQVPSTDPLYVPIIATIYGTSQVMDDTYFFAKVDDFSLGNIKFSESCVPLDENNKIKKKTRNSNLFMTAYEPLRMSDDSIDKTKFVLLDIEPLQAGANTYQAKEALCERTGFRMINGIFSASSIMRDFLRYRKPFNVGKMNYSTSANYTTTGGFDRQMYSLIPSKVLKQIDIPFCFCSNEAIDPYRLVRLPNNTIARFSKASFELASDYLSIELLQETNCGFSLLFPDIATGDNCPARGTVLSVENAIVTTPEVIGSIIVWVDRVVTRTTYADGECGTYVIDI